MGIGKKTEYYKHQGGNVKEKTILTAALVAFFSLANLSGLAQNRPGLTVKETFDVYIEAIQKSDLEGLFTTVTADDKFFFLTSGGRLINTRQGYYKFHEDWFGDKGWSISFELLEAVEGQDYGYTNAIYRYQEKTPDGKSYFLDSYFTLIFHREEGMWRAVVDVCTPIRRSFGEVNPDIRYSTEQQFLFDTFMKRRTVRRFQSAPVPKEHLLKILDAARSAPTAGNQQPWKFLVVENREKLNLLKDEAAAWYIEAYKLRKKPEPRELADVQEKIMKTLEAVLSAPVYVAVLVDSREKYPDYVTTDGALAAGYLMTAARALGYGTGFFTTFFPEDRMKKFFSIPDAYRLICFTPIGIPDKWPDSPQKKKLEDLIVFESFQASH
jgi:nitroreductase/ketosteroid isomerase-like protein